MNQFAAEVLFVSMGISTRVCLRVYKDQCQMKYVGEGDVMKSFSNLQQQVRFQFVLLFGTQGSPIGAQDGFKWDLKGTPHESPMPLHKMLRQAWKKWFSCRRELHFKILGSLQDMEKKETKILRRSVTHLLTRSIFFYYLFIYRLGYALLFFFSLLCFCLSFLRFYLLTHLHIFLPISLPIYSLA